MAGATGKNYQSRSVTREKFDEYLECARKSGRLLLPSERDLTRELRCGRGNVREVLAEKERLGEIIKKGRGRALSLSKIRGGKTVGSFSFVAGGEGIIANNAWAKLWARFHPLAEAAGMRGELVLSGSRDDSDKNLEKIAAGPEVVVFANYSGLEMSRRVLALPGRHFILLDEQFAGSGDDLVTIDNYEAGRLAAGQLRLHGYRKPALICQDMLLEGALYKMYARRVEGFRNGCRECGLDFGTASELWFKSESKLQSVVRVIRIATKLRDFGFDAAFLHTDDLAPYLYQALIDGGVKIPQDMGLVTVNSFNDALNHHPQISSVSHATAGVASRLVNELKKVFLSGDYRIGHVFVKPSFHEGETLL